MPEKRRICFRVIHMEEQRDAEGVALYVKAQFTVKTSSRNVSLTSYNRGAIFLVQLSSLA